MVHTARCSNFPRCRAPCRRRQQVEPPRPAQNRQVHRGHHPTLPSHTAGKRNLFNVLLSLESEIREVRWSSWWNSDRFCAQDYRMQRHLMRWCRLLILEWSNVSVSISSSSLSSKSQTSQHSSHSSNQRNNDPHQHRSNSAHHNNHGLLSNNSSKHKHLDDPSSSHKRAKVRN